MTVHNAIRIFICIRLTQRLSLSHRECEKESEKKSNNNKTSPELGKAIVNFEEYCSDKCVSLSARQSLRRAANLYKLLLELIFSPVKKVKLKLKKLKSLNTFFLYYLYLVGRGHTLIQADN